MNPATTAIAAESRSRYRILVALLTALLVAMTALSVAIGYVPKEIADEIDGWEVEILGEILPARLQPQSLFDANGSRMRN